MQAATSHLLGTNFAKMFEIEFEGKKRQPSETHYFQTHTVDTAETKRRRDSRMREVTSKLAS